MRSNGAQVAYGTEARAVCPFLDFIRFQQQQIYTVGIGRVQSGETDGANLGGNAAGVVEGGFRRIVRRDARRIARAINDCVTRKVLARLFPGRPVLAQFAWDAEAKRTSREVLEDAGLARAAGLAIDIGQLAELTGYTLEKAPETPQPGPFGGLNSRREAGSAFKTHGNAFKNAARVSDGQGDPQPPHPSQIAEKRPSAQRALEALSKDSSEAAKEISKLMEDPTPEAAAALLEKLPSLLPEDPALAAVIAEAMAEAYGEAWEESHAEAEAVANAAGIQGGAINGWHVEQ